MSEVVLFVIDTLEVGGAELSLLENISRFRSMRPVVCHLYEGSALKSRFEERGIPVHSCNVQAKYGFIQAFRALRQVIKEVRPGIIVAYLTRSELLARTAGRFYGIPVVGTLVSDLYSAQYNRELSWKARRGVALFRMLNRVTARWCCGFLANSQSTKEAGVAGLSIPPEKIRVIPRGRDGSLFTARRDRRADYVHFLNVGRLAPVKRQDELVRAFARHLSRWPDDRLDIAGNGPCGDNLLMLIRRLGLHERVRLLGRVSDVPALMGSYDGFVLTSASEGFSGTVVEAMFAGLPVLASDIPSVREAIKHLKTGYLFRAGAEDEIARAMDWLRRNAGLAENMAAAAREYARMHFELGKIAQHMEEYLQLKYREGK